MPTTPTESTAPRESAAPTEATDRLVRVGGALFVVGVLCSLAAIVPLLTGASPLPVAFYFGAALAPVGFGLVLLSFFRRARRRGRTTRGR